MASTFSRVQSYSPPTSALLETVLIQTGTTAGLKSELSSSSFKLFSTAGVLAFEGYDIVFRTCARVKGSPPMRVGHAGFSSDDNQVWEDMTLVRSGDGERGGHRCHNGCGSILVLPEGAGMIVVEVFVLVLVFVLVHVVVSVLLVLLLWVPVRATGMRERRGEFQGEVQLGVELEVWGGRYSYTAEGMFNRKGEFCEEDV
ncbi:hypothetical protein BDN72DRAFT_866068 [Pluteus cervinus]|uniref:Uncharacterized protein n=1 Tax=Pluteus cervinus TaxID=181527 RepID=A0ACD2ZXM6_9AGAR|nr:hypothetical protein BDN72DRAFT_866068 [Pluteus cervinus]